MSDNDDEERPHPEKTAQKDPATTADGPEKEAGGPAPRPAGRGGPFRKVAVVAIVVLLVGAGLGFMLLQKPEEGGGGRHNPPAPVNETIATPPVYLSEVMPEYGALGQVGAFVEIHVADNFTDLKDWKLTTYDNDSFVFNASPGLPKMEYYLLNISMVQTNLSLNPSDELGLYDPQGRLVDFVRWGGGNSNTSRGGWPAAEPGPSPAKGESVSRLDEARFWPEGWNPSPPSPSDANILAVKMNGIRQVIWVHSGRQFSSGIGPDGAPSIPPGKWMSRDMLVQAAYHLEYAFRQMQRLGEPLAIRMDANGTPILEFWVTNDSTYQGMTGTNGRVSLDLGENRHINAYLCAREMARLFELGRWGVPNQGNMFIREGMAIREGVRAAASEIAPAQPSVDGLWSELRLAGLANPFENGLDPRVAFISPWAYDGDHAVCSWLFFDFCERKYLDAGLGTSLSQAMLASSKDPLISLPEQLGRNLTALYWDWLAWRTSPGFKYPAFNAASTLELGPQAVEDTGVLNPWTGRCVRMNISISGMEELNLTALESSSGPLQFLVISYRNGSVLARTAVWPGQSFPLLVQDLQPLDELVLVAGSGDRQGEMVCRASPLPEPPSGLDPHDGNYTNLSQPLFAWSGVNGVSEYELQLSLDRTFSTLELAVRTPASPLALATKLAEGRHYWRVRGWTALGNPTGWSRVNNLTVDTMPPFSAPLIGEPRYRASPDDIWNISASTQISFNYESTDTVFFRFSDLEEWQTFSAGFIFSGPEGPRTVQFRCRDIAGNIQPTQLLQVNLDIQPPGISVDYGKPSFAAAPGDIMNVTRATKISMRAADNWSGVSELKYRIDSQSWMNYSGEFNISALTEGTHILAMACTDMLGNDGQQMSRFCMDSTPPVFTLSNITNGTFLNGDIRIWINGSDGCGIGQVSYLVDNVQQSTAISPPYDWLWRTSQASDGTHPLEARVQDNVGNEASASVTVATENIQPSTSITVEEPKYRASGGDNWNVTSNTPFNLTVTHSFSGTIPTIPVWYTIDGAYYEGTSFKLLGLPSGRHNLTYGSRGVSGLNETAKCISVELDNNPPAPVIVGPAQDEVVCATVLINVTDSTNATDIRNCTLYYSTDSVNWNCIGVDANGADGWNVTWDTTLISNGNYWLRAEMADNVGNIGFIMISVLVQNT